MVDKIIDETGKEYHATESLHGGQRVMLVDSDDGGTVQPMRRNPDSLPLIPVEYQEVIDDVRMSGRDLRSVADGLRPSLHVTATAALRYWCKLSPEVRAKAVIDHQAEMLDRIRNSFDSSKEEVVEE